MLTNLPRPVRFIRTGWAEFLDETTVAVDDVNGYLLSETPKSQMVLLLDQNDPLCHEETRRYDDDRVVGRMFWEGANAERVSLMVGHDAREDGGVLAFVEKGATFLVDEGEGWKVVMILYSEDLWDLRCKFWHPDCNNEDEPDLDDNLGDEINLWDEDDLEDEDYDGDAEEKHDLVAVELVPTDCLEGDAHYDEADC